MTASMVMLGAYVRGHRARRRSTRSSTRSPPSLPSYRAKHVALNVRALRAGFEAAPDVARRRVGRRGSA